MIAGLIRNSYGHQSMYVPIHSLESLAQGFSSLPSLAETIILGLFLESSEKCL